MADRTKAAAAKKVIQHNGWVFVTDTLRSWKLKDMSEWSLSELTLGTWLMVKTRGSLMRLSMIAAGGWLIPDRCVSACVCASATPFARAALPCCYRGPSLRPSPVRVTWSTPPCLEEVEEAEAACTQVWCGPCACSDNGTCVHTHKNTHRLDAGGCVLLVKAGFSRLGLNAAPDLHHYDPTPPSEWQRRVA